MPGGDHLGLRKRALPKGMERKEIVRAPRPFPFSDQPEPAALAVGDAFPPAGAILGRQGYRVPAGERLGIKTLVLEVHEQHAPRDHRKGSPAIFVDPGSDVKGGGHEATGGEGKALDRAPALFLGRTFHPVQMPLKNLGKGQGPSAGQEGLRGNGGGPGSVGLGGHESLLRRVVRGSRRVQRS